MLRLVQPMTDLNKNLERSTLQLSSFAALRCVQLGLSPFQNCSFPKCIIQLHLYLVEHPVAVPELLTQILQPEHVPDGHAELQDVDAAQLVDGALPEHVPDGHAELQDVDAAQLVDWAQVDAAQFVHVDVVHPCGSEVVVVVAVWVVVCATAPTTPKTENATIATIKTAVIFLMPVLLRFFLGGASISGATSITNDIFSTPTSFLWRGFTLPHPQYFVGDVILP